MQKKKFIKSSNMNEFINFGFYNQFGRKKKKFRKPTKDDEDGEGGNGETKRKDESSDDDHVNTLL